MEDVFGVADWLSQNLEIDGGADEGHRHCRYAYGTKQGLSNLDQK